MEANELAAGPRSRPTFLVTGGASGIGRATARILEESGARVIVLDAADATPQNDAIRGDVRDPSSVNECLRRTSAGLDGLIACAALGPLSVDPAAIIEVDYAAAVRLVLGLGDRLREWSSVVLISSTAAYREPWPSEWLELLEEPFGGARREDLWEQVRGLAPDRAYALAKWGILQATRRLAGDLARRRIRVNCVVPGPTRTSMSRPLWRDDPASWTRLVAEAPAGTENSPEDVAGAITFLAGPSARMVYGSILHVDGGWHVIRC